ncbi:protein PHYLLO [Citrus sinensis]|uniref:Protein PHYLLO n=1 Tax=Citrus sinensis TaxID=2711 RepID=A0ACB8LFH4_CITSI|nr:protein PHYLLO [Citrus sinensis]
MHPFTLAVKAHHVHFTNSFSTESSISKHRLTKSLGIPKPSPPLKFLTRISGFLHFNSIDLLRNSGSKVVEGLRFDGPVMDVDEIIDCEEGGLVVETCITRTLPPALTLEHGLESISEAVNKLRTDPPSSSSGVLRFQVAVPPSAKALDWFCRQPESSEVFPVFFLSRDMENPTSKSLYLNQSRGVFGIGAAVYFTHPAWCDSEERTKPKRYLSTNPIPITTYGFMDVNFNTESSCIKHEAGSFYFFVPQIELKELDDISILAVTLAWSNGMVCTFEQAIQSFESSFCQMRCHKPYAVGYSTILSESIVRTSAEPANFSDIIILVSSHFCSSTERYNPRYVRSALTKFNMMEDKTVQMVCMNAITLGRRDFGCDFMEMREAPFSFQFSFRFSPTLGVANNMLDNAIGMNYSLGDHVNINAVWASLLIEECSRLAPGSRSSPLAVAASTHPLITCIACYDERSLAFHALGYARGSHRPAVIITSSGTAVSNLLPAVVEASQDFVPVLLLTADRPPELQDAGANQAINQVDNDLLQSEATKVMFFFSLPAPTDQIPARMILTTLDSAVHWATSSPYGPVHINCPFREPLDNSPKHWMSSCLKGLDIWTSSIEPFTKYIQVQHSHACKSYTYCQMAEVLELVQGVNKGLLLVGAVHNEDEIWAVLHLARHIRWPVVADILSGLRLRKLLASFPETEQNILFLDHLDHALLSESVKDWIQFDVIIQIGSRITSKRISQMIEECFPCTYILVDNHPCRHDPSHSVTHRIQSTIVQFVDFLLKVQVPHRSSKWCSFLRALDMMVASEISFQICADYSLTEPHVAHELSRALTSNSALFVGNSMAIRDLDMYGRNWTTCTHTVADIMLNSEFPHQWIRVAGNRGASGIDGLLSTAIGFAVGCNKHVLCVVGDISFLHDTNGLAILKQRMKRKPILMLVINNHGGAIFSLLPIADRTEPRILDQYFYTTHNISIQNLCLAHGLNHVQVKTKVELEEALSMSQHLGTDRVIEVESCIDANATFHSMLRKFARQSADHTLNVLSQFSVPDTISCSLSICKICRMEYSLYRIQLCAPPTSSYIDHNRSRFCREGFILSLYLEDGSVGYGEVAPLEIHKENLLDAEEQLRFLLHFMTGAKISYFLPLLKGSFSSWIWSTLGIPACEIFPSVRCGLEMAILNAIAVKHGSSFLNILYPLTEIDEEISKRSTSIKICALIDSNKSPVEVASIATTLVEEGFTAIKLKVARRADPIKDAEVIQEVRKKVGHRIELRVDANRNWTYQEALEFGFLIKDCDLQYIEEPVQNEEDIIKYCEESGLPVALDETIDKFQKDPLNMLEKYAHPGIVAIVIKPSVIGGFENAGLIARWAQRHGKMAVVSAAFESGLAQGLGTYQWLKEDVTTDPISICHNSCRGFVEASVAKATHILQNLQINNDVICKTSMEEQVLRYQLNVNSKDFCSFIKVQEIGQRIDIQDNILLFLHGFLGTGEEWIPIMKAVSGSARCISIDLPGHGGSKMQNHVAKATQEITLSIDVIADVLYKLIEQITPGKVTLVGYSMGARIALYMALRFSDKIKGTVIISGSPGLRDNIARKIRRAEDDSRACSLVTHGLQVFLDTWYTGELWERPLWEDLKLCSTPLLIVVGEKDKKFKSIAEKMCYELSHGEKGSDDLRNEIYEMVEIPNCGHAVHLENPLPVIRAVRQFLTRVNQNSTSNPESNG